MSRRRIACSLALLCATAGSSLVAQAGPRAPRQLSLNQALELARANNPTYQQALTQTDPAAAAVKAAQWALFPTLDLSGGVGYTGAGSSTFGGTTFNQTSPTLSSSYSLSASWQLGARSFLTPSYQKAVQRVTEGSVVSAAVTLTSDVTTQYLNALRAAATVLVAAGQVSRDSEFVQLAQSRQQVGAAAGVDVLQAQTTKANADVQLLQARQAATLAKIELIRRLGLTAGADIDSLQLTENFPLAERRFELEALRNMAHESNPSLKGLVDANRADSISIRMTKLDRLPVFSISTGISGYTQQFTNSDILLSNALQSAQGAQANCVFQNGILQRLTSPHPSPNGGVILDCNAYAGLDASGGALQPELATLITSRNSVFPFSFTRQPWSIRAGFSVPIWDGYANSLRLSQARAKADNTREMTRETLQLVDAQIQSDLLTVQTAWATIRIQDTNRGAAQTQLQLARERYRLGSSTALDVTTAQNAVTFAEVDYVTAVYNYHLAVVSLEAAVGRPLR